MAKIFGSNPNDQGSNPCVPAIHLGNSKIVFANNMDPDCGLPSLSDHTIHLTFTSPPYYNYITYEGGKGDSNNSETYQQYIYSLKSVFKEILQKTAPNGKLIINISNMKSRKTIEGSSFVYPIVADTIQSATDVGWTFFDEIIWDKQFGKNNALHGKLLFGSYPYPTTPKILDSVFENILVFKKSGTRAQVSAEIKAQSKLSNAEWREYTQGIWKIKTNINEGHPATFPMELAERIIRLYSFVGDLVLDPYAGTGTTIIAASNWDRQAIGFEIAREYEPAIIKKYQKYQNRQGSLFRDE